MGWTGRIKHRNCSHIYPRSGKYCMLFRSRITHVDTKQTTLCFLWGRTTVSTQSAHHWAALIEEAGILSPTNDPRLYGEWLPCQTKPGLFLVVAEEEGEKIPAGHARVPLTGRRLRGHRVHYWSDHLAGATRTHTSHVSNRQSSDKKHMDTAKLWCCPTLTSFSENNAWKTTYR